VADHVERHAPDFSGMLLACPVGIFPKLNIQDPMLPVLDGPDGQPLVGDCGVDPPLHVCVPRGVVVLESQDIIGTGVNDGLGDGFFDSPWHRWKPSPPSALGRVLNYGIHKAKRM